MRPITLADVVSCRTRTWFDREAEAIGRSALIVERLGRVVGFTAWRGAQIESVFVVESEYGNGTAAQLLAETERAMIQEGTLSAFLHCRVRNKKAVRFYEKHGWQREGHTQEVLEGVAAPQAVDVWRMVKRLG
jgi:GNAT superfamily N-acetyltransferase